MIPEKANTKAKSRDFAMFTSMEEMGVQMGIPYDILKEAKKNGCEMTRNGRVDLKTFIQWYFTTKLSEEEQENWTRRDKRASALNREHTLMLARKEAINFSEVTQYINDLVGNYFFGELERLAQEFPAALKGKTEVAIQMEVERQNKAIKEGLAAKLVEWAQKRVEL